MQDDNNPASSLDTRLAAAAAATMPAGPMPQRLCAAIARTHRRRLVTHAASAFTIVACVTGLASMFWRAAPPGSAPPGLSTAPTAAAEISEPSLLAIRVRGDKPELLGVRGDLDAARDHGTITLMSARFGDPRAGLLY